MFVISKYLYIPCLICLHINYNNCVRLYAYPRPILIFSKSVKIEAIFLLLQKQRIKVQTYNTIMCQLRIPLLSFFQYNRTLICLWCFYADHILYWFACVICVYNLFLVHFWLIKLGHGSISLWQNKPILT